MSIVEHYRRGFYDPYTSKGNPGPDLVIDTETDDQQATLKKVLERVRPAGSAYASRGIRVVPQRLGVVVSP